MNLLSLFSWWRERSRNHPHRLFHDLCRAHGLTSVDRRVLEQFAAVLRLEHTAQLFFEPHRWDDAKALSAMKAQREPLKNLRQRLFSA